MSDYTPTGKPQTLSPQVSKQMRDEFQSVADAVNSKSDVDGDTYSGVHDFTNATLEVPTQTTSDNSNKAASTAFVQQVAASSSLPSQAGHATETLITDGVNASWGRDVTKANKAGDTYTGTHNFTSAAVTVPTYAVTTFSDAVASTAFVRSQPDWAVTDITTSTYTLPGNRRGEMYVCGGSTTTVTLPAPTTRYFARIHNPNPGAVTVSAGTGRTINGSASIALQPGSSVTVTRDGNTTNYRAFFFNVGGGGGGGLPYDTYQDFLISGTFTVQKTGWHRITVIGAGGSGGRRTSSTSDSNARFAGSGGGAGGTCVKEIVLTQGVNYTVTIGAGGASVSTNASGNAGGDTIVTGPDVSMIANGGRGGNTIGTIGSTVSLTIPGGVGGDASGGDVNYTGGNGGQAQILSGTGQAAAAGGGGAPSIFGTRPAGGDGVAAPSAGGGPNTAAAGGGASAGGGGYPSTRGGGLAGSVTPTPSDNSTRDYTNYLGTDWRTGYPVRGNTPTTGDGRGYGSGGSITTTPSGGAQAFAGSGGACIPFGSPGGSPISGAGGLGGGSGGTAGSIASPSSTGAGGDGFVIFEWVN